MNSPCIKVCKIEKGLCIGCLRTIEEIENWTSMTDKDKYWVLDDIALVREAVWRNNGSTYIRQKNN